ncbi:MAG: class I SAM-dependent methyltransferase [Bacteroidetes bacterium]|nr:class I SAM-dependent methyltransferase [Bacteroidota bacterium]
MNISKDWFVKWFDSPYYPILYKNRNNSEAELFILKLLSHIQLPQNAQILDLACGRGRHALVMSQREEFQVTGIDLSENSISDALKLAKHNLHFFVHDMRNVFKKNSFDLVTNLFTSFGYFETLTEDCQVIEAVFQNLKPNGLFVIDYLNCEKVVGCLPIKEEKSIDSIQFSIDKYIEDDFIFKLIKIRDREKVFNFAEKIRIYKKSYLSELILKSGFSIVDVFGNYNLDTFEASTSDRIVILAQKK